VGYPLSESEIIRVPDVVAHEKKRKRKREGDGERERERERESEGKRERGNMHLSRPWSLAVARISFFPRFGRRCFSGTSFKALSALSLSLPLSLSLSLSLCLSFFLFFPLFLSLSRSVSFSSGRLSIGFTRRLSAESATRCFFMLIRRWSRPEGVRLLSRFRFEN